MQNMAPGNVFFSLLRSQCELSTSNKLSPLKKREFHEPSTYTFTIQAHAVTKLAMEVEYLPNGEFIHALFVFQQLQRMV